MAAPITLDFKKTNDDKRYFNSSIAGNNFVLNEDPHVLRPSGNFSTQYNQSILDKPNEYYLAVMRLQVPTSDIPVFIADPFDPATDPNELVYEVGLVYNGITYTKKVEWIPLDNNTGQNNQYYWIQNYNLFLYMINQALEQLLALIPSPPAGALAPYFIFDPTTRLFSFVAQQAIYGQSVVAPINVLLNYPLLVLFEGLSVTLLTTSANNATFQVLMLEAANNYYQPANVAVANPPIYLINTQTNPSISAWNPMKSIQVTSSSLPVVQEIVPSSQNSNILGGVSIIKDFVPLLASGEAPTSSIDFINEGPYQLINLTGEVPITKMDLSVRWVDKYGRIYPILIPYNSILSIKLGFFKKSTFTS